MPTSFVHLHSHTEYSLIDGLLRIEPWLQTVADLGMPACALTDQHNLFAAVKFYETALKVGVKPIFGCEFWIISDEGRYPMVFLCQNHTGYQNLTRLISRAYIEGQDHNGPSVLKSWLTQETTAGLIVLSGGRLGDIGQALLGGKSDLAAALIQHWKTLFPKRFYLELQRTGRPQEETYNAEALKLAATFECPVVATNDVRFLKTDDFDAHETRVCIHDGDTLADPKRPRRYSEQQYLRSPEEMIALFSDIPEAIINTVEIAKRCNAQLTLGTPYLPNFPIPDGVTIAEYLEQQSKIGLNKRYAIIFKGKTATPEEIKIYDDRLTLELSVINNMGFPGYFLIVADFIQWARDQGIPVGPGRGSGAGSLVAYALGITDLDPLQYELLFERFLNPERVSMPDFDVDFCMEGRDRVIDYVAQKYGRDSVSQIITYGSMAAKAVVRDVGRALAHPYGFVDKIAKLIPFEVGITLESALNQEEELQARYHNEEDVKALIDLAKKLEGITRNAGKHAGGVVIAPSKLTDFVPLYCEPGGANLVTQFDKDDVEAVGLVKFDFLGLRTLTIIDWAVKIINQDREVPLDITQIPMDDSTTFALLKDCNTTAVFQLESRGMKELINRLQPDSFEEIIALVALFRPGPLQSGMVDDFIDRKHGKADVEYPHPDIEPILKPTYGVILYQEQVMQIAQVLAGYTLGAADLLRRAMGKKKPEEMAKQRSIFTEGAKARGVEPHVAKYIFDLMEKFAGYGFNKSHSAAYALVAYQTAWLKAHYPEAFMAAVLSADMDNTDKVVIFIEDCRACGIDVLPPHVQTSAYKFTVVGPKQIRYGLGAIKGVGESAIESIIQHRDDGYRDIFQFCKKVETRKVNRRALEALIRSGAMDGLGPSRASLLLTLEKALKLAEQHQKAETSGQVDLFGQMEESQPSSIDFVNCPEWTDLIRLQGEKDTLGHFLSGHPYDSVSHEFARLVKTRLRHIGQARDKTPVVAGLIINCRKMITKRGSRMAIVTLDDGTGRIEAILFADECELYKDELVNDAFVALQGEVTVDEYSGGYKMRAQKLWTLDQLREQYAQCCEILIDPDQAPGDWLDQLKHRLQPKGKCPIEIHYQRADASGHYRLPDEWRVKPNQALLLSLRHYFGTDKVRLRY